MSNFSLFKKYLLTTSVLLLTFLTTDYAVANQPEKNNTSQAKIGFTPPPIPQVNTSEFKEFVRKNHTFPSPFGYEPYRDKKGKEISVLLKELNPINSYIPVTIYCNSNESCPAAVAFTYKSAMFNYNDHENIFIDIIGGDFVNRPMIGFYFPNDPRLYSDVGFHIINKNTKKGDPIVTILFSQRMLQSFSEISNGKYRGYFATKPKNNSITTTGIDLPSADGKEFLEVGTTLSVLGLGEASGVEFTETVSQTTGETFTTQVQTGFNVNISLENEVIFGGGVIPASDNVKFGINTTLSHLVSNGLEIANQNTVSRTYTIKPGINDTYYWAIYQLLYSYRIHAPKLEKIFKQMQSVWENKLTYKIADNQTTQDGKLIGNPLPPQTANAPSDVTVGVAVPVYAYAQSQQNVFAQVLK